MSCQPFVDIVPDTGRLLCPRPTPVNPVPRRSWNDISIFANQEDMTHLLPIPALLLASAVLAADVPSAKPSGRDA